MKWVSLRRLVSPPASRQGYDRLFVDNDGTLKSVAPDGTVTTVAGGGSSDVRAETVTLDAAAVRALGTTPAVLVEGVPDKLIVLLRIEMAVFQGAVEFEAGSAYLLVTDETQAWGAYAGLFQNILAAITVGDSGMFQLWPSAEASVQGFVPATALTGKGLIAFTGDPMVDQGDGHIEFTAVYALADAPA